MNRKETPRFLALGVLIGLVCLMVIPTGAETPEDIPILDSKVSSQLIHLGWLNDDHVVIRTGQLKPYQNTLLIWDTLGNTITKYLQVDEGLDFCVHDGVLTQLRQKDQHTSVVTGPPGAERTTALQKKAWLFNRFSCLYVDQRPVWAPGPEIRPLREEHGYLDFRHTGSGLPVNPSVMYYRTGSKDGIALPVRSSDIRPENIRFAHFANAYLLYGDDGYKDPKTGRLSADWPKERQHVAWWLTPEGKVTEIRIANNLGLMGGMHEFFPVLNGIFFVTSSSRGRYPGTMGGYMLNGNEAVHVIAGRLSEVSVSPNGCRVAFVHDPSDTEYGKDRLDRITVKMADLCQGAKHAK